MKWIRYLVPLVLAAVASTAHGQWYAASSRYAPPATAGPSWPSAVRVSRLIVAEEPPPVAAGGETIVSSDSGMPCDDCSSPGWFGHHGGKNCGGHCKLKKHCCAARQCGSGCETGGGGHCKRHHFGWAKGSSPWSSGDCCNGMIEPSGDGLAPQPEPAAEPIETPRQAPPNGSAEPATKSASRGGQWPTWSTPTWSSPMWSSPQPTRARTSSYEYRTR